MLRVESMKLPNEKIVNFSLNENDALIIQGKNGSGKSLLLKSLAQLCVAPYEVFNYQGDDIKTWIPEEYRSQVLYVSTSPLLLKDQTVEEFFTSIKKLAIYKDHHSYFDYKTYLEKWHIPDSNVAMLSSGQKQMISILRSLTLKAKILLLDEPTANLDYDRTLEIESLLIDWRARTKGSLVIISHSSDQIARLNFPMVNFQSLIVG